MTAEALLTEAPPNLKTFIVNYLSSRCMSRLVSFSLIDSRLSKNFFPLAREMFSLAKPREST